MAAHQFTTIPRARGIRAQPTTAPTEARPHQRSAERVPARARSYPPQRPRARERTSTRLPRSTKRLQSLPSSDIGTCLQPLTAEASAHILGHLIDGIGFIETACTALQTNERTAYAMPCLHQGIGMLRHVHHVLDQADAEMRFHRRSRRTARLRMKRKRAP
jgi:hypothetical protein